MYQKKKNSYYHIFAIGNDKSNNTTLSKRQAEGNKKQANVTKMERKITNIKKKSNEQQVESNEQQAKGSATAFLST